MSRLTRLKDAKGATVLYDKQYSYNAANQISGITDLTETKNFSYDNVDRLTGVTGSSTENYAFDSVGNRTSSNLSATYAYQPNNRLTNTATASYAYNINGNMTSKTDTSGTTNYVWDFENRLKQATKPNGTVVNFKYDALGRRSERNINGTTWTKFTYDGQDVMLDQNSDGTTVRYLNGLGIDNKLRMQVGTTVSYFLSDHLGSTTAQTDATGNVTNTASYDAFGNSTGNLNTRYQFTGREFDADLGLQYSRARFYDAKLGRFISEDPIGFRGGDVNLFGYVGNNPKNFVDPSGLAPNQRGVTNPEQIRRLLQADPNLENFRDNHGGNDGRYFYTENFGWVDNRHFAETARRVNGGSNGEWVRFLGLLNETYQWCTEWGDSYRSGFSPEDLPSNAAGIDFGNSINPDIPMSDNFSNWANNNGARDWTDPRSRFNNLPVDDPSGNGGIGRGSSNVTSNNGRRGGKPIPNGNVVPEVGMPPYIYF